MEYQDRRGQFTIEELRQRYKLEEIVNNKKAIESARKTITALDNEQNKILQSIMLSLEGIKIQSEIMLWFFNGLPSDNEEVDFEDKTEHIGDLYYDRETGYVYQFKYNDEEYEWVRREETNLVQAMALTNASIDTEDNQRRVFLDTPTPPYNNGDWYIRTDGSLYICQISKDIPEVYDEKDFIIASKYVVGTQASEMNGKITILAGQVTTIEQGLDEISQQIEENKYYLDENGEQHLISSKVSELEQTANGFTNTVTSIQENLNTINNALSTIQSTILEQTSSQFQMWFEQTGLQNQLDAVDNLVNSNNTDIQTLSQYIRFFEGKIELGRSDSQVKLLIENDKISFMTGTNESAYISNNKLYITDSTILSRFQVGKFVSEIDDNGNLNKRWID